MKLLFNFLLGFLFLSLLFIVPSASAQYYGGGFWYGTEQVIDSVVQNLEPLFRALLGGYDWSGYLLFEKVLLFILFSIIVGLILEKLPVFERFKSKKILRLVTDKSVQDYLLKLRNKEAHNRNIYLRNSDLRKNIYDLQHQKSIIQNEKEIKSIEKEIVRLDKLIDDNERRIK